MIESWKRLKELFEGAIRLPASDRASFLTENAGDEADLRAELEAMLEEHDEAPDYLEPSNSASGDAFLANTRELFKMAIPEPAPPSLPGYEVIRFIERGGFGQTWLVKETLTGRACAAKIFQKDAVAADLELSGIRRFKERSSGLRLRKLLRKNQPWKLLKKLRLKSLPWRLQKRLLRKNPPWRRQRKLPLRIPLKVLGNLV